MRTVAFLDAAAGLSGDMVLGALVDAGLPLEVLEAVPRSLGFEDVRVEARRTMRGALAATKVDVRVGGASADVPTFAHDRGRERGHERGHEHGHEEGHGEGSERGREPHGHGHRRLADVLEVLRAARDLPAEALADAARAFRALAEAEGRVHGVSPDEVAFHEVGEVDALVDVVGACVGLRRLGVTEVRVSSLPWGSGTVRGAHGLLPVPAPAVAHLLAGFATFPSGEPHEQITPTGAALVRALSAGRDVPAGFVPRRVGLGAGTREHGRLPNVLRLVLGEVAEEETPTDAVLLETNLDDATGQTVARAVERALAEGALDAWAVPATMKKGRPGIVLSVLAAPGDVVRLTALLFRETPTLGVRRHAVGRTVLARHHVTVRTPWGEVRMKVRRTPAGPEATPEHDDCRLLSERHGVPLLRVMDAARDAFREG